MRAAHPGEIPGKKPVRPLEYGHLSPLLSGNDRRLLFRVPVRHTDPHLKAAMKRRTRRTFSLSGRSWTDFRTCNRFPTDISYHARDYDQ
jgi:hypothetical protein